MEGEKPWKEGVLPWQPVVDPLGRIEKTLMRFGRSAALSAFTNEFTFFTPAILYISGVISDAPLIDFVYEYRQPVEFYYATFKRPVFARLETRAGDPGWNHGLWAIRNEYWEAFCDFYCSIAVHNAEAGRLWRVGRQTLQIADPLAVDRMMVIPPVLPTMPIHAFGINGDQHRIAFKPSDNPGLQLPELRYFDADGEVQVFAEALVRGVNPHTAQELYAARLKEIIGE